MDLFATEHTNAKALSPVKVCALALFFLSGMLLVASLLMQPVPQFGSGETTAPKAAKLVP
jgi:hypothetical protein